MADSATELFERATRPVSLSEFANECLPLKISALDMRVPAHDQYVLRMLIVRAGQRLLMLPSECAWVQPLVDLALAALPPNVNWLSTYGYLTIRNGIVRSVTDDQWHVDGFSTRVSHLPELNFVWTDCHPTEYVTGPVEFPNDFDPQKHNVNPYLARRLSTRSIRSLEARTVYAMDPYILHRRPTVSEGIRRCFVRLTFAHVEIDDINNTFNSLLPTDYHRDGVRDVRDLLLDYDCARN